MVLSSTRKSVVAESRNFYHGKEHRGATEKNIVVLSSTRKSIVAESRNFTTEKNIVVPRKRTSWSYQAHENSIVAESKERQITTEIAWNREERNGKSIMVP